MATAAVAAFMCVCALAPARASASVTGDVCKAADAESKVAGGACNAAQNPGRLLSAGKNLLTGHFGSAFNDIFGGASSTASTVLALGAVVTWSVTGAKFALDETAKILSQTTRPQLRTTWFSAAYWRMAGIAALLTIPFLFAAAVQALMRSDLALLTQAAFGYLPLAMLAVGIAAPLTMLLLAATDQLCAVVSSGGADSGAGFLSRAGAVFGLAHFARAPFVTFGLAAITVGGALVLWLELAVREAAVYVVVLMLPLAFAALVWPARRVWAVRAVEMLVALILSKFAIVAVLGLAGAALGQLSHGGLSDALAGTVLVLLAAFAPWALLRLLPLSELASGAAASLRPGLDGALKHSLRDDKPASESPPQQRTQLAGDEGARHEAERLREQPSPVGRQERTRDRDAERSTPSDGRTAVGGPNGRRGVLASAQPSTPEASAAGDQPGGTNQNEEPPEIPLGPEGFDGPDWVAPKYDLLSGPPGMNRNPLGPREDHNPLPPSEDHNPLPPGEDRNPLPPSQDEDAL